MQLEEIKPKTRTFTLTLDEDELKVIQHGLFADSFNVRSGNKSNNSVFIVLGDLMKRENVALLPANGHK